MSRTIQNQRGYGAPPVAISDSVRASTPWCNSWLFELSGGHSVVLISVVFFQPCALVSVVLFGRTFVGLVSWTFDGHSTVLISKQFTAIPHSCSVQSIPKILPNLTSCGAIVVNLYGFKPC